jgi:hypothetical protein
MFDGRLKLGQTVTVKPEDSTVFEQPEYPLDNPNIGRSLAEIAAEPYVGYIIAADEIVICEHLTTKGNDLVLAAKTIQVGNTGAITINTKPADFVGAANEKADGLDADNGGDLVFLCQRYTVLPDCTFFTSGGTGQHGGAGKPMTMPDFLEEGVHFDKPQRSGSVWGLFWGTLGNGQCKFHVNPTEWGHGWRIISYNDYHNKISGPAVNVTGEWTLWNGIQDGAPRYFTFVHIPDMWYPSVGRPGGYGGNPGKISLIIPSLSVATGVNGLQIQSNTGADGVPGEGGAGGDCTPDNIVRDSLSVPTPDYLEEYTIGKAQILLRGEPGEPFVGGWDRFKGLKGTRLDSSAIVDKQEDSICGVSFGADLLVLYAPNPDCKRRGVMKETFAWGGSPWPIRIWVSAVHAGSPLSALTNYPVDNSVATPKPNSMHLYLDYGPRGEPKPALPTEKESLNSLIKNWYQAIYELLPEYPLGQYKQADEAYRRGDFNLAADLYDVVLCFAQEVPDFQAGQATVVSDAGYRLDRISAGYDYFGFTADTIIPTSPTRDYLPLPLTTAYSDTVEFYAEAIQGKFDSIETIEMGKDVIQQFLTGYQLTTTDIQESMAMLDMEMAILESETDAMEQEINAIHWANQRLSGLLQRWAQRVDDKIKQLQKEKEDEGPGFWDVLTAIWNVIELVVSIVMVCYGFVAAVAASIDALQKLGKLGDHINDLRIACGELVSNLDDWSWEQISEYLDAMKGVTKEIEAWYADVKQAWEEADSKLQKVKATFEETRTKLDQLTAVDMNETEAIDFQNNVLLADEIGVSGAMDYLQIQEQIYLNNDILGARYSSLEALTER